MIKYLNLLFLLLVFCRLMGQEKPDYVIVIHGGAGNIHPDFIPPERAEAMEATLGRALQTGMEMLASGKSSLDVVEKVVMLLEDSPLFNAGKGSVFTRRGKNEMDACIMDGHNLEAGGVTGVGDIKNPISAARLVMEKSPHVLLMGRGASEFAAGHGIEMVDSSYFWTEKRWNDLQKQLKKGSVEKYGTVGCVALDTKGDLAAATSTGGRTNKLAGRIGDTPIVGHGNYANNSTCAVSGTGHGEFFMRLAVAYDISALMQYKGITVGDAAREVIHEKVEAAGGTGGVICVDANGNIAMEYNTHGMLRAWGKSTGERGVRVFTPPED